MLMLLWLLQAAVGVMRVAVFLDYWEEASLFFLFGSQLSFVLFVFMMKEEVERVETIALRKT